MAFDIRTKEEQNPSTVRFADSQNEEEYGQADIIKNCSGEVRIYETNNGEYARLHSREHAEMLIQALQFAIEKEWFNH